MIRQYPWRKNARSWKKKRRESVMPRQLSQIWSRPSRWKKIRMSSLPANPSQSDDSAMTSAPTANNAQSSQSRVVSRPVSEPSAGQSSPGSKPAASAPGKTDSSQNSSLRAVQPDRFFRPVLRHGIFTGCRSGSPRQLYLRPEQLSWLMRKQFLGNPYVYGGTSLTNGADCSGFTQSVFAHFGITTGRSSRDQAAKGKEISMSAIQPGDLLFYASGSYINHVAIYIGDGKIIHSSNPTTGITITKYNYRTPCKAVTFLN